MAPDVNWGANPPWATIRTALDQIEQNANWNNNAGADDPNRPSGQEANKNSKSFSGGDPTTTKDAPTRKFLAKVAWHVAQIETNGNFGTPPQPPNQAQNHPPTYWLNNIEQNLKTIHTNISGPFNVPPANDPEHYLNNIATLLTGIANHIARILNGKTG